jgi:hypothetical protein
MLRVGRVFVVVVAALALAGCSAPTTIAYATYNHAPAGFDSSGQLMNGEPAVTWLLGHESFAIVTFGSSSCPPVPIKLDAAPPSAMTVTFVPSPTTPCTADLRLTAHHLYLPKGMDASAPIDVHIVYDFPQHTEYDAVLEPGP